MEKEEYNNIINSNIYNLLDISNINDLVIYKYQDKYLIEYLLEKGIHNNLMDNYTKYRSDWISFYLKYKIFKPLLNSHLKPLLEKYNKRLILDYLLENLSDNDKLTLYNNLKVNSYWDYHVFEDEVILIYSKYNIKIPKLFINNKIIQDNLKSPKKYLELIDVFKETFADQNDLVINIIIKEIKKRFRINPERTYLDIKKIINYKKENPDFKITLSSDSEGLYNSLLNILTLSPYRQGVVNHELSHLFYEKLDNDSNLEEYEKIRIKIDNRNTIKKIYDYLRRFHIRYEEMGKYFKELYHANIRRKYGSYDNYADIIQKDLIGSKINFIQTNDANPAYFMITSDNTKEITKEILIVQEKEYISNYLRNYYSEELMLENLLDAILKGKIFDDLLNIECLSGHSSFDFIENESLSFDECLADYDMIKNSNKANILITDLKVLVGDELVNYLENYLVINRGDKRGYWYGVYYLTRKIQNKK